MSACDIIVVSYNNPQQLQQCVESLGPAIGVDLAKVIIVNNGDAGTITYNDPAISVIDAGKNLGWEGGLKLGLEHSTSEFVCFLNDDTFFPVSSSQWLQTMLQHFRDPKCGAVGPSCNNILGLQNIWSKPNMAVFRSSYLIGVCMLLRRSALDACGGVDDTLPGGDDIDLSIRLRKAGYHLIVDRNTFIYHHLSQTGKRVHGDDWDSVRHQEAYMRGLWEKHTFREWVSTMNTQMLSKNPWETIEKDLEGEKVKEFIVGEKVYELGCGDKHTCCGAIGVDIVPKGQPMDGVYGRISDADVVANVFDELPFKNADTVIARHILEHTFSPFDALLKWKQALRPHGGRLVIAVPDERCMNTIPLNPQHKSAFTPDSLTQLAEAVGYKVIGSYPSGNPISFVTVMERNGD